MRLNIRLSNFINLRSLKENRITFHTSSIGELNAFYPLIKEAFNFSKVNISVFTKTGYFHANKIFEKEKKEALVNIYSFPILNTFSFLTKQKAIFIYENDFWPQMFYFASKKDIPIFIFDLRISKRHLKKYKKLKFFYLFLFKKAKKIFVPKKEVLDYLKHHFSEIKDKFSYHIPLKLFKFLYFEDDKLKIFINLKKKLKNKFFLFASLHDEEAFLLEKAINILQRKNIKILISPRHPENIKNILKILEKYKEENKFFIPNKEEFLKNPLKFLNFYNIICFPYFGIQKYLYAFSDYIFVGGSFNNKGGHDILEPSYFEKIVFIGPSYENQIGNLNFVENICILENEKDFEDKLLNLENLKKASIKEKDKIKRDTLRETLKKCLRQK